MLPAHFPTRAGRSRLGFRRRLESKKEKMDTRDAMPWATLDRAGEGYEDAVKDEPLSDEPIEKRTLKELVLMHQKATLRLSERITGSCRARPCTNGARR